MRKGELHPSDNAAQHLHDLSYWHEGFDLGPNCFSPVPYSPAFRATSHVSVVTLGGAEGAQRQERRAGLDTDQRGMRSPGPIGDALMPPRVSRLSFPNSGLGALGLVDTVCVWQDCACASPYSPGPGLL